MDIKKFGGCLWFDSGLRNQDYYGNYKNNRLEVDSGRSAIQFMIEKYGYKRIWLPVYNCPLVYERIRRVCDIEVLFYNLKEDFSPDVSVESFQKKDLLLWVNYCGVMYVELIDKISSLNDNTDADVIIDNIPAFFSKPRMNVFNIYSCRKFIGVPDGGYLIGDKIQSEELEAYETSENYLYLLKAIERGSNAVYNEYQERERLITEENKAYGMPALTKRILSGIDYDSIKDSRIRNFRRLHELLGERNELNVYYESDTPSVYPYFTKDINLREKLIDNDVFISRFWKHVLTNEKSNAFERSLAEYLIPLPIDQRYKTDDMDYIAKIVEKLEHI